MFQSDADSHAPPAMGHSLADAIPNSHLQIDPREGHLSLFAQTADAFLRFLADSEQAEDPRRPAPAGSRVHRKIRRRLHCHPFPPHDR